MPFVPTAGLHVTYLGLALEALVEEHGAPNSFYTADIQWKRWGLTPSMAGSIGRHALPQLNARVSTFTVEYHPPQKGRHAYFAVAPKEPK
jgi:hypothetical protein